MAEEAKKSSLWIWIVVVVVVIAGLAIWYFTRNDESVSDVAQTEETAITIPDGWLGFTSNKYHFSLSYPSDYTLTEGSTGTLKLTKDSTEMIDMYVYAANGDEAGMMTSQENLYTDDSKDYMIMDSVVQGKVAGIDAKTVSGKFGKNAGVSQTHEGVMGSSAFFATDDKLFIFNSYDNGDPIAQKTFTDLLGTISF